MSEENNNEPEVEKVEVQVVVSNRQSENQVPNFEPQKTSTAGLSLILGIISVSGCCCDFLSGPCAILAIVLSINALIKKTGNKNFAIAGLILGIVALVIIVIFNLTSVYQQVNVNEYKSVPHFNNLF